MKMQLKRMISVFLVISILLSALPTDIFAADTERQTQSPFSDVNPTDWFYEAVLYAKTNGIFNGTGVDTFSPQGTMTRGMYVTILGRIAKVDTSQYKTISFSDVPGNAWYAPYTEWAAKKGITAGTGNGKFSPELIITREQMATLTARYFEIYGITVKADALIKTEPKDLDDVAPWAREAVLLLWRLGIFKGDTAGNFNPQSDATRAEGVMLSMSTHETVTAFNNSVVEKPKPPFKQEEESTPQQTATINHTITFNTNGGDPIANWVLQSGTLLNNLPIPYKIDTIFTGWYKNSLLTEPVGDNEILTSNMTLYADYSTVEAVNETEIVPYISKVDQAPEFTIQVDSTQAMTADQVKSAITFQCITDPEFTGIEVTGSSNHFTIAAQGGKFEDGAAFKVMLNDENLSFTGEDASSDIYNFTIIKPEILNLGLTSGMVYIPATEVSNMTQNGQNVMSLSIPIASTDGTDLSTVELTAGNFTYNGPSLQVGDIIAIYEGISPELRTLNTSEVDAGTVAYVTITQAVGNTYYYENSDSKDVLFTPDILPVSVTADTDGNSDNDMITVSESTMTFTNSSYAEMGLNGDTTVDQGDFIAFYSGAFNSAPTMISYERITQVSRSGSDYIISYESVTQDEMMAAMELSSEKSMDGEQLLENVNVSELEAQIEQQAIDSGFVNESAAYIASLAMETDSFKHLEGDFNLDNYTINFEEKPTSTPNADSEDPNVELENLDVDATLGTNLKHFKDLKGVRCVLNVSFDVVIHGDKSDVVIHVTGIFEEEVRIKIKASGGAVWKHKGIFPYIADYRINATIDAYNFTGVQINSSIGTFKKTDSKWDWADPTKVKNIAQELKDLLDKKDTTESVNTVADTLAEKYSTMLKTKSDWVELVNKELFNNESFADPYHILVYGVKVNFVISANMNVSIGCEFSYENAKRYIFSIGIYSETSSSDTISLVEGKYKFTAYVMGTLGLKAGIRIELATGLFTLKLSSIGIVADVGAYMKLWGYFYYELTYSESEGKSSKSSGALFVEIGIYLKISFKAQAFKGTFKYTPTLYENEWPLWYIGSQKNVNDFSYAEEDTPSVSMAKNVKKFVLPNSVFKMKYMDMKTGKILLETFDDSKDFKIKMSNSDFVYDPELNTITVTPGSDIIVDGKMTITWKAAALAFTSKPISRTIALHWENLKDAYSISFNSKGGSSVNAIALPYNSTIVFPADPVKEGYVFGGWYLDQNYTQTYAIPTNMPSVDVVVYAKWTPALNTPYTVEHYQQNVSNDLYTLVEVEILTGTTDEVVTPARKSYVGFTAPTVKSITVAADGSGILKYYYTRNSYQLIFNVNDGTENSVTQVKYGTSISAPVVTRDGYNFGGWSPVVAATMPNSNTTYVAQWSTRTDIQYKVNHYQQNSGDEGYTLVDSDSFTGTTLALVNGIAKTYTGFTYDSGVADTVASGNIAADGTLVLKLYYTRNVHTLTFDANGGSGTTANQVKYGATITAPTVTKTGYTLTGWSPVVAATMPNSDTTYVAQWSARTDIQYKVTHYQQNLGDDEYTLVDTDNFTGTTLGLVNGIAKTYTGFTYDSGVAGTVASGNIAADGTLVLKLYYTRNVHTLTFDANGGSGTITNPVKYGASISAPTVTKTGYTLSGWSPVVAASMSDSNTTYVAQWAALADIPYKVTHYQQNLGDDEYTLVDTDNLIGSTLALVNGTAKAYTGFTYDSGVAGTVATGNIAADGTLVLKLYYTRNVHTLTFDANGGSGTIANPVKYGASINAPVVTKTGYTLSGWSPVVAATMPDSNTTYVAQWAARTDIQYKVTHYQQNLGDDDYTLVDTDNLTGTTLALVNGTPKAYTGFTYDSGVAGTVASGNIAADGTLVLKLYYTRNVHTLTFDANGGSGTTANPVKYGATINPPVVTKTGYTLSGWSPVVAATMPDSDTTYVAQWAARTDIPYKVTHYQQNLGDDDYTLVDTDNFTGTTLALVNGTAKTYTGFTYDSGVAGTVASGNIAADGTLVLKLYYTRNVHTLTFDANGGSGTTANPVKYGASISAPVVTKTNYIFTSWSQEVAATMPDSDVTYTAQWTERIVPLGAGTVGDPYLIATFANLKWISDNNTANTGFSGVYFKQTADIDMSATTSQTWVPIGSETNRFSGSYDGNGFSAENLFINSTAYRQGLFGVIGVNGIVFDLGVTNVNITSTITGNTLGALVGGLVGTLHGTVLRCYSTGTVTGDGNTGGLIGYSYGGTIKDSYSRCTVNGNGAVSVAWAQVGGFIGKLAAVAGRTGVISNCYATGNISAINHPQVAGLSGEIDTDQEVYSSFATGSSTGASYVAGIIGVLQGPMHNAYTTSSTFVGNSGTVTGGGTNMALVWFKTLANFTTAGNWHATHLWDFQDTWAIDPSINDGFPYLKKSKLGR